MRTRWVAGLFGALLAIGCGGDAAEPAPDAAPDMPAPERASDHFMMPAKACIGDDPAQCFWNANGGSVPEGERFADHGDCPIVRTQGIPWQRPVNASAAEEPRLANPDYASELAWVTAQVEASACVCCHDSRTGSANIYDVGAGPTWITGMTDRGLMMAAGIVDTDVLGAFPVEDNHGFDRFTTVFPTTDLARFQQFFMAELSHRGVTQQEIDSVEPLGGPLTENALDVTEPCAPGTGVDAQGVLHWPGGAARYAWILEADAVNPGIPPNLDLPAGTLWHAGVHHDDDAVASGAMAYSVEPTGAAQLYPPEGAAPPALEAGTTYKLFLLRDHGQYLMRNCTFTYPVIPPAP